MWKEREITDFLGISTKRQPQINECADCSNIELRDTNGDMLSAVNPGTYLSAPDFSAEGFTLIANLGFTTHVFSILPSNAPVQKEVTFYFQRGTITDGVNVFNHIAIGMYPNYLNGSWYNAWRWMNKIMCTTLSTVSSYTCTIPLSEADAQPTPSRTIYNVTKDEWATILAWTGNSSFIISKSGWSPTDKIMIMRQYLPIGKSATNVYDYFTALGSIVLADLTFHRVLNDLRIGFGSVTNRLGVGIGYRKKYFQIDTTTGNPGGQANVNNVDNIELDPYNIISDTGTFVLSVKDATVDTTATPFPNATIGYLRFTMTAILDDFNEYVVTQSITTLAPDDQINGAYINSQNVAVKPTIRFATMNKRVTKIRIWVACSKGWNRTEDYKLIKEIDVSKSTALGGSDKLWTLGSDGLLILSNVTNLYDSGYFQADYAAYKGNTETQGLLLSAALGYTPTLQYASSWDQALVSEGATYLLNPYIDRTWKNFIFNSPISGAGAFQYDVISAENYQSLDMRDGNDIVGMELNSNQNFTIIRNLGYHQYNPTNQVSAQMINGIGIASTRLGIVNQNDAISFPSQFDYYVIQGNQNKNLSENTIRDAYRKLTKSNILGARENYGNSIIFFAPTESKWYTFVPGKGWMIMGNTSVLYFGNSYDGTLIYMNSAGNLYKINPLEKVHTATTNFYWVSVPIDIALLGEEITSDDRFIIGSVWVKYSSSKALTAQISYDGGVFGSDRTFPITQTPLTSGTLVIGQKYIINSYVSNDDFTNVGAISNATGEEFTATGTTPTHWAHSSALTPIKFLTPTKRFTPGRNCKSFQIKISGTLSSGDVRSRISAIGINWLVFKTGLFR